MQQNLIVPAVERSLSGVVLNVDSLEETIAVQNADLQDREGTFTGPFLFVFKYVFLIICVF